MQNNTILNSWISLRSVRCTVLREIGILRKGAKISIWPSSQPKRILHTFPLFKLFFINSWYQQLLASDWFWPSSVEPREIHVYALQLLPIHIQPTGCTMHTRAENSGTPNGRTAFTLFNSWLLCRTRQRPFSLLRPWCSHSLCLYLPSQGTMEHSWSTNCEHTPCYRCFTYIFS